MPVDVASNRVDEYVEVGVLLVIGLTATALRSITPRKLDRDPLSLPALAIGLLLCGLAVGMNLASAHGIMQGDWLEIVQRGLLLAASACSLAAVVRLTLARPG